MEATSSSAEPYREAHHIQLVPGPREFAAIVAFWAGYALLTLANRIFDQGGPSAAMNGRILVAAIESLCWIVVTPILFALVGRFDLERSRSRRDRWIGLLVIALVTIASAAVLGLIGRELRELFTPFPPRRGGRGGGPPEGVRLWFGFFNSLVLALGVVAVGVARAYSRRLRSRREQAIQLTSQLAEARLDALRRQLDPHFLFNTLNAIAAYVRHEPEVAESMLARLSTLLRLVLESSGQQEVAFERELEAARSYLAIHEVRFGGRLAVAFDVDPGLEGVMVPAMVLQPIIENAVVHGVAAVPGPGRIEVAARRRGGRLLLSVGNRSDAPVGAPRPGRGSGLGLANTRARLEQLYGAAHRMELATCEHGAEMEVEIPLRPGAAG
jgi:two-component system, LytTR family, sensor kinase